MDVVEFSLHDFSGRQRKEYYLYVTEQNNYTASCFFFIKQSFIIQSIMRTFFNIFQAFKVISDARSMDRDKSLSLLQFYFDVEREIMGLDDSFLNVLKTSEGDVLLKMRSRIERMESRDYIVLVAGKSMHVLQR